MGSSSHDSWFLLVKASQGLASAESSSAWVGVLGLLVLIQLFSFGILAYAIVLNRRLIAELRHHHQQVWSKRYQREERR